MGFVTLAGKVRTQFIADALDGRHHAFGRASRADPRRDTLHFRFPEIVPYFIVDAFVPEDLYAPLFERYENQYAGTVAGIGETVF